MTGNLSSATSVQQASANITQQYAGTCNVQCNNTISNVNFDFIDSVISGGINLSQQCTVNANCLYQTTQNSLADVLFKAQNSSSAAGGVLPGISVSKTSTYQDINENILNSVSQSCSLGSYNDIDNVNIFAQSSVIGGGINFSQTGATEGACTFNTLMSATDMATGTSDNCSASGKSAKKSCGGKGSGIGTILLYAGIGLIAFVGIMMLYKAFRGPPAPGTGVGATTGTAGRVATAAAAASSTTAASTSASAAAAIPK